MNDAEGKTSTRYGPKFFRGEKNVLWGVDVNIDGV